MTNEKDNVATTGSKARGAWCVLRTGGGRTLPLAASLNDAGFEVWTPSRLEKRRRPRSKVMVEHSVPIMPTFVFAHARHVADLLRTIADPLSPHPHFSIMHYLGRVPLVSEAEIAGARAEEDRWQHAAKKEQRRTFPTNSRVRVTDGPAKGLSGIVDEGDGQHALVCFGGAVRFKIATWLLEAEQVENNKPDMGVAA